MAITQEEQYISGPELLAAGWTRAQIATVLGIPALVVPYPWHVKHYWFRDAATKHQASPEFAAKIKARQDRADNAVERARQVVVERDKVYERKYGNWEGAVTDGATALFLLNRYAKNEGCTLSQRTAIYAAKNEMIELLYREGMCTSCSLHRRELPEQECFGCDGTGTRLGSTYGDESDCCRCGGTGIFRAAKQATYVVFRFLVGGVAYCWHQPKEYVKFPYVAVGDSAWVEDKSGGSRGVTLSAMEIGVSLKLIDWITKQRRQPLGDADVTVELVPEGS